MKRNESENSVERVERYLMMLREDWKVDYWWLFIKMLKDDNETHAMVTYL